MNETLKSAITNGDLILFLGAGASRGCKTSNNVDIFDGNGLAKELAKRAHLPYEDEPLDDVYSAARRALESRLDQVLEELFRHTQPSQEYLALAQYAWRRIYTLNIDDGLDKALHQSKQKVHLRLSSDSIEERDQFFSRLDYIKLNGSADRLKDGIIFSSSEYAKASTRALPWYEQCASDFVRSPFLFIGTQLNEPLLKFHIERYKAINGTQAGKSYVITPSATKIQSESLLQYNIVHIPGTLASFIAWLQQEFPKPLTPVQLAAASLPQYANMLLAPDRAAYIDLLEGVSFVKRDMLSEKVAHEIEGSIRSFYKGFQPTWKDIVDGLPANLDILDRSISFIRHHKGAEKIIPLVGPAGSGKTTLLMQISYELCGSSEFAVYYINEPLSKLTKTLEELERSSPDAEKIFVAIDNVDYMADQLVEILKSGRLRKTTIISAERENVWSKRTRHKLGAYSCKPIPVREFSEADAERIIDRIKLYGSWTILGQMSRKQRIVALIEGAQKQLLIALLEATYGRGFEQIIENDYATLSSNEERIFLLIVGVITERHCDAPISLVDRALGSLGILSRTVVLSDALAGIVTQRGDKLSVRHPVYVRYLLEQVVDPKLTSEAVSGLLHAFSHFPPPIMKHVSKMEATIYKGLINHRFLFEVLKGRETLVISLYKSLEKLFELDGLFWLQYGLALRDFHNNEEALDKLRTAFSAYAMDHTQHALGQQLLIVAANTQDPRIARNYLDEARSYLEALDDIIDSDDVYPIVTLAQGHTKIVRKLEGDDEARSVAKSYIPNLKRRCELMPENQYLSDCYETLFKFAATGTWIEIQQ
ncbi:MAG TPA: SIR2 family protein [Alphaproteobacteria bacterium]|nr:SIR2 family protein [Alphaproteobacteria bacterium]